MYDSIMMIFLLKERSDGGGTISRLFECMSVTELVGRQKAATERAKDRINYRLLSLSRCGFARRLKLEFWEKSKYRNTTPKTNLQTCSRLIFASNKVACIPIAFSTKIGLPSLQHPCNTCGTKRQCI